MTWKDNITNDYIQEFGVVIMSNKVIERRFKWFWHVIRRPLEHACREKIRNHPEKENRKTEDKGTDAVNRDMEIMGMKMMMADDRRRRRRTIIDHNDLR